jgi:hypothetical protein
MNLSALTRTVLSHSLRDARREQIEDHVVTIAAHVTLNKLEWLSIRLVSYAFHVKHRRARRNAQQTRNWRFRLYGKVSLARARWIQSVTALKDVVQ